MVMKFGIRKNSPSISLIAVGYFLLSLILTTNTIPLAVGIPTNNVTDQEALLSFKHHVLADPFNILSSWNTSLHFCNWHGILCSLQERVTVVNVSSLELSGSLSPYVGNLTFLRALLVANNSFHGVIPEEMGRLFRLQNLELYNNSLQGVFPSSFANLTGVRVLDVSGNSISGSIPPWLSSMPSLSVLRLHYNRFDGMIPPSLGNLSSLLSLSLSGNNLSGSIPDEIGSLSNLVILDLSSNNLAGTVPVPAFYNLSSLLYLQLAFNRLNGTFPPNLGFTALQLRTIYARDNQFTGSISESLANASQLVQLDVGANAFTGVIPSNLENLPNLQVLQLDLNLLGGELPNSITNLTKKLTSFRAASNMISGSIPDGIGNLINLQILALNENRFSGRIPSSIGNLANLQGLYLSDNSFYGDIPSSIGNITRLSVLSMRNNLLQGSIPPPLVNCRYLQLLDLSHNQLIDAIPKNIFTLSSLSLGLYLAWNQLSGALPVESSSMVNLGTLDISNNQISGGLPPSLGGFRDLEFLYVQGNHFQGQIPSSLVGLRGIQVLDLSRNNFSGQIPQFFATFDFIQYLNLSFNRLEGEVPNGGVFGNSSAFSVLENKSLCGGLKSLMLPSCPKTESAKGKFPVSALAVIVVDGILFMFFASVSALCLWPKISKFSRSLFPRFSEASLPETSNEMVCPEPEFPLGIHYPRLTYADLLQATNGFSEESMVGKGGYSLVYKGVLASGEQTVAVKVLNLQQRGAKKSFVAECQAIKNVRHRNLVKTITACSGLDFQGREFKALVYEFMSNGSLESWIHPSPTMEELDYSKCLSLTQRLDIAIDVASSLHYLHNCCETPIIHRDLKPSNILLDDELHAHVGDFGSARILLASTERYKRIRSTGIPGTVGYIALEYGIGGPVSTLVDVYSYGILLLEMFTGKRPTDSVFKDSFSLRNYVNMFLPHKVMEIVDPQLISEAQSMSARSNDHSGEQCLASILRVGVICSSQLPKERMDAANILVELTAIRNDYL